MLFEDGHDHPWDSARRPVDGVGKGPGVGVSDVQASRLVVSAVGATGDLAVKVSVHRRLGLFESGLSAGIQSLKVG